jgi:hypothetical protein
VLDYEVQSLSSPFSGRGRTVADISHYLWITVDLSERVKVVERERLKSQSLSVDYVHTFFEVAQVFTANR